MDKPYVIGIDVGGTNTVIGIVDKRGQILRSGSIKTAVHAEVNDYLDDLSKLINEIVAETTTKDQIKGIGVGAPNGNYFSGSIEFAPNLRWKGIIPFARLLEEKVGIPVALTNDANAAAIGEMTYGAARGMKDFIVITLGTGVGSGIVVNGQLVYGHDGFAGELGHVIMRRNNGRLCGCGRTGCLETYASATGVARTAREYLELRPDMPSQLRSIPAETITSKDVFDAAMTGDEMAKEIFRFTGKILGEAFADFVAFSSPEAIILFGGLAKAGDLIMKPVQETMESNLLAIFKNKVKLLFSELKESDAAVLGASALGWEVK
ncbi:MAG TPA: glucokinase [Porphyromonadaceae bacterium]|jgi:glucokinase|uniref:ROK family protein n=1 Tax=Limibacterium fermenti TaxID=3229863 RepID=UPI000E875526|nr:glucokinase [Porphyromonadaceae bacterium]HBL32867.1 glucokinase [Porphyromonadaceae bacterium]HBX19537.1 glucokinase [Porphyromonadaceae bacterium]HBX46591.1 glucokinase [Porphyromonadaceae bacterium]HCM20703.1 glucokinase [Porphyromonadaceae bacterium]